MPSDQADDEFYKLMSDARKELDPLSIDMAGYYYEYADFLLGKMERNLDMFNPDKMPANKTQQPPLDSVQ